LGKTLVRDNNVQILSWNLVTDSVSQPSRQLSDALGHLSFRAHVKADITDSSLKSFLHGSMSSGIFVANLVSKAHKSHRSVLMSVKFAELVEFAVKHEKRINREVSGVASVVIAVGAVLGLALGFVLLRTFTSGRSQYTALASTSISSSFHGESLPSNIYAIHRIHDAISSEEPEVECMREPKPSHISHL